MKPKAPRPADRRGGANIERNGKMEITQKEINALANKAGRISTLLQEVNTMAFELAKAGNNFAGLIGGNTAGNAKYHMLAGKHD